jgi:hypothetical protein
MALDTHIKDGEGTGYKAGVTNKHALKVTVLELSTQDLSADELTARKNFRGFLSNSSGSTDLNVNGSSTSVLFKMSAVSDATRWISGVRVLMNDVNLELDTNDFRRFGTATAVSTPLTNGLELYIEQGGIRTDLFVTPITTIGQFMDYADRYVNFINAVGTQEDFLSFDFDFDVSVALPPGSLDFVAMNVQDDLTNIDLFKVIARGRQEVF